MNAFILFLAQKWKERKKYVNRSKTEDEAKVEAKPEAKSNECKMQAQMKQLNSDT